jgi:hypothetical protein
LNKFYQYLYWCIAIFFSSHIIFLREKYVPPLVISPALGILFGKILPKKTKDSGQACSQKCRTNELQFIWAANS